MTLVDYFVVALFVAFFGFWVWDVWRVSTDQTFDALSAYLQHLNRNRDQEAGQ